MMVAICFNQQCANYDIVKISEFTRRTCKVGDFKDLTLEYLESKR